MHYRIYGNTGREVSLLGFGGMRFSRNEDLGAAAMLRAYELGINYFDTAPFYCRDRSLDIFGKALPLMDRDRILISSKSNLNHDKDEAGVRRRVDGMLKRMHIDRLDILYMWCIFSLDQYRKIVAPGGPYEGALKLKEEGVIGHVAFSAHAPTEDIVTMCREGRFEGALVSFNVINHAVRRPGLQAAGEMNMGLATMNPLGGGMLAELNTYLESQGRGFDGDFPATALRFVASHAEVTTVLSGMKSPEEVEKNVAAVETVTEPSREEIDAIGQRFSSLGKDFCTICRYCLPCPESIDIPAFMAAYDLSRIGMDVQGKQHLAFRTTKTKATACTECGECEEKCTQQLDIIERLKEIEPRYGKKY